MTDTNYLDVGCPTCGHVPQGEKHLCDTTPETEGEKCICGEVIDYKCKASHKLRPYMNTTPETVEELVQKLEDMGHINPQHSPEEVAKAFSAFLHQQLQKVREEERMLASNMMGELFNCRVGMLGAQILSYRDRLVEKPLDHSELDQDITSTTK